MGLLDKFWSRIHSDPELQKLDDEQNQAVVDALVGAVFVDGNMAPEELKEFDLQLQKLPWRLANDERARERVIARARDRAESLSDPDAAHEFVEAIAARLVSLTVRDTVYRMCLAITFADADFQRDEVNLLGGLRQAFGIPEPRAEELERELREELDGSV